MKKKDTQNKTIADLDKSISDLRVQIGKASVDLKMRKQKNTNIVKTERRQLAQFLTARRELELASKK